MPTANSAYKKLAVQWLNDPDSYRDCALCQVTGYIQLSTSKSTSPPNANTLPKRRRKDRDIENDRENGLRMKKKTMKEKDLVFLLEPMKEKLKANVHLSLIFCPINKQTLLKRQRAKSCQLTNNF